MLAFSTLPYKKKITDPPTAALPGLGLYKECKSYKFKNGVQNGRFVYMFDSGVYAYSNLLRAITLGSLA